MRRKILVPVFVALLVVTAGCAAFGGPGSQTTDDPAPTASTTGTDDAPDASTVKADALAASQAVETYRVTGTANVTQTAANESVVEQQINRSVRAAFDRPGNEFRVNQTVWRVLGDVQTGTPSRSSVSQYLVDGTLYRYTAGGGQQSDAEWTTRDGSAYNRSSDVSFWDGAAALSVQQTALNGSAVTMNGTATVGGTEAHVLQVDVDDEAVVPGWPSAGTITDEAPDTTFEDGTVQFYVATDSGRLLKSTVQVSMTGQRSGATLQMERQSTLRFHYGERVTITLPEGAEDAGSGDPTSN